MKFLHHKVSAFGLNYAASINLLRLNSALTKYIIPNLILTTKVFDIWDRRYLRPETECCIRWQAALAANCMSLSVIAN